MARCAACLKEQLPTAPVKECGSEWTCLLLDTSDFSENDPSAPLVFSCSVGVRGGRSGIRAWVAGLPRG